MYASRTILSQTRLADLEDLTGFLIQAGFLIQEGSGLYSYTALGQLAIERLEARLHGFARDVGAAKWQLSHLQQQTHWDKTGRDQDYGEELMSVRLRSGLRCRLTATAEEQVTSAVADHLRGRHVDFHLYQLSTKWRDEIRARGGLLRGREFRMFDAYHFASSEQDMHAANARMRDALVTFLESLGCTVRVVSADCGEIGGLSSEELQVATALDESGWLEVGHCFALGQRYTAAFGLTTQSGEHAWMSCQGLGTTRLLAVLLAARRSGLRLWGDDQFSVVDDVVIAIGKDEATRARGEALYRSLLAQGHAVVFDDRFTRAGQQLTSSEALGARTRWVVSDRLGEGCAEKEVLATSSKTIEGV